MNAHFAANYLFMGPLIEQRLREQFGDELPVEPIEQYSQATDSTDLRPVVLYVLWGGERVAGNEAGRTRDGQRIDQVWVAALRVRSVATGTGRNGVAGPWLGRIHRALNGWAPQQAYGNAMARAQGPAPSLAKDSGLYPLAFQINLKL